MRHGISLIALAWALASSGVAFAQAPTQPSDGPAPVNVEVDGNGVDLVTGAFNVADVQAAIGDQAHGGLYRLFLGDAGRDNFTDTVNSTGSTYTVSIGMSSSVFTLSGSTFTNTRGDGSTLTQSGTNYTYTARDGTIAVFSTTLKTFVPIQSNTARITSLTSPTGEILTFTYVNDALFGYILTSINNNRGYQLKYNYAQSNGSAAASVPAGIIGLNNAVEVCPYTAETCSPTNVWPSVTIGANARFVNGVFGYTYTDTDNLGRTTVYQTPIPGTTQTIKRPSGFTLTITYDASGRAISYSNGLSTWNYAYTNSGTTQTTVVTDPLGNTRTVVSDQNLGVVTSDTDGLNRTTTYAHDTYGRTTKVTYPEGNAITYAYDARGNITTTTRSPLPGSSLANTVTTAYYNAACSVPATCNKPYQVLDANNNLTSYTYDSLKGVLLTATLPSGLTNTYTYQNLSATFLNSAGASTSGANIYLLVGLSQCLNRKTCAGLAAETKTTIYYGSANNLAPTIEKVAAGNGAITATNSTSYDPVGNVVTRTNPLGRVTGYRYDTARQLIGVVGPDPDGAGPLVDKAVRATYNADGLQTLLETGTVNSQSDADWANFNSVVQSATLYDAFDRKSKTYRSAGSAQTNVVDYSYDAANRLSCVAVHMNPTTYGSQLGCSPAAPGSDGPDRITHYTYDNANEVTVVSDRYGTTLARNVVTKTYKANGEVATAQDANGNLTTFIYDGFSRIHVTQYPSPTTPGASNSSDYEQYGYDANDNIVSDRQRNGTTVSLTYNAANQLTQTANGAALGYDTFGRLTSSTLGSQTVSISYDQLSRKTSESNSTGAMNFQYDNAGERTATVWPDGTTISYIYDLAGNLTAIEDGGATSGQGDLANYTYDSLGRRTAAAYAGNGAAIGQTFNYDAFSRLSAISYTFADSSKNNSLQLTYNEASQIALRTVTNSLFAQPTGAPPALTFTVNGLNQAAGLSNQTAGTSNTLTSNANGDVATISGPGTVNGLTTAPGATLAYDGLGRLVSITNTTTGAVTQFAYDGNEKVGEYGSSGNMLRRYIHGVGADAPVAWYEGAGNADRRWLLADQQGSIIAIANPAGQVLAANTYDPYGAPSSSNLGRFQYTGQAWIPEVGLYDYKARFYSPQLRRFMQPDPSGYAAGMNIYSYAHGDPVNNTDSTGLDPYIPTNPDPGAFQPPSDGLQNVDVIGHRLFNPQLSQVENFSAFSANLSPNPTPNVSFGASTPGSDSDSASQNDEKEDFLSCTSELANKASLAPAAHAVLGNSGPGGFVANAFGNPVSGAIDLVQSALSGSGGGHSYNYNSAQAVVAGPAMGFSGAFKGKGGGVIDVLEDVALEGAEWGSGIGEIKFGYDIVTAVGAGAVCAFGAH